jgi:hypothetical protein
LFFLFSKPRLFVSAGYEHPMGNEPKLLDDSLVVKGFEFLADPTVCGLEQTPGTVQCDQSLSIDAALKHFWTAGLDVEFAMTTEYADFKVDVGAQYLGHEYRYSGNATRTDRGRLGSVQGIVIGVIDLPQSNAAQTSHALGPKVALSINAAQLGPIAAHFYLDTSFFWYINDDEETTFGGTFGADSSRYSVELDGFITRATAGFKLVWR